MKLTIQVHPASSKTVFFPRFMAVNAVKVNLVNNLLLACRVHLTWEDEITVTLDPSQEE